MYQSAGGWLCGEGRPGERVGCQHGVIDDLTCAYMTELNGMDCDY